MKFVTHTFKTSKSDFWVILSGFVSRFQISDLLVIGFSSRTVSRLNINDL